MAAGPTSPLPIIEPPMPIIWNRKETIRKGAAPMA